MKDEVYSFPNPIFREPAPAAEPGQPERPKRNRVLFALAVSLALHIILLLLFLLVASVFPERTEQNPPVQKSLVIQLMPSPAKKPVQPAEKRGLDVIDPRGMQASTEKPAKPQFESDRDMKAGSELPASGVLPLPSQQGRTDRPANDFANQDLRIGAVHSAPSLPSPKKDASRSTEPPRASPPSQALPPLYDPNPVAEEKLEQAKKAAANEPIPEPAKLHSTPPPLKRVAKPDSNEVAVTRPSEVTEPGPITHIQPPAVQKQTTPEKTRPTPPTELAMNSTPQRPSRPATPDQYEEQLQKTRVEGTISNRARAGVDAVATPLGRYLSQVKTALGSSWNPLVTEQMSVIAPGSATIVFSITAEGRITGLRMESNTSNASYGSLCEEAVRRAPIPQPPTDLVPSLRNGALEYSMTFTFFTY